MRRLILPLALAGLLTGCGGSEAPGDSTGPLRVVTTTGIVADQVARIAGEHAEVTSLMGPGVDPHLYKASESDVRTLADADLIFYNGIHLEGKMADVLVKMARQRPVVAVTESVDENALREPPEFAGQYDPHVWFDVSLWAQTIPAVVGGLSEVAPEHADTFAANGEAWRRELERLDAKVAEAIATIPAEDRVLVTAHDAFGYFGRRYDIEVVGLQGISTASEAGLKDVQRVVDLVVDRQIPALFIESSVPRRAIEAVQAACRDQGWDVVIGGEFFSDSMGAAGTPEGTYPGMVRHNVETIVTALGGSMDEASENPDDEEAP